MIERTVEELTPIIGTRPGVPGGGRVCGDDLPPPPAAGAAGRHGRGRRRTGRCQSPSARRCSRCCTPSGSSTSRRRRPTRRCWTRAPTCARPGRCTGSSAAKHGGVRERRDSAHPPRLRQARAARRAAERAVVLGREQAEGPGEVDVVLPVRDPRRVQPFCGAPQNGCSVPGSVMWPAAVGVNDDGGERPGCRVFGHIMLRAK